MPATELPPPLQESILATLIFHENAGATIAAQVLPKHFEDTYREVAEKVLAYRHQYGRAPGRAHLDDLFGKVFIEGNTSRLHNILVGLAGLAEKLNTEYVVSQAQEFIRGQLLKATLVEANSRYEQGGESMASEVEAILSKGLNFRAQTLDAGIFLDDTNKSFRFFDRNSAGAVLLGIPALDSRGITLNPKELFLYIGGKGTGKSWAAVHVGVQALAQRQKVVHLTLELSEEKVVARYYQRIFAAATRPDKYDKAFLEFDDAGVFMRYRTRSITPTWNFSSPDAKTILRKRMKRWGTRLGNIVVKSFPSGSLTVTQLEGYLDFLELNHKFIPNVLIVDYPDLMSQDIKQIRVSIGRTFVDLRGILHKRNLAGFMPTQTNRAGLDVMKVKGSAVAEDVTKLFTADTVVTYSRTPPEKSRGLARLHVEHTRESADGMTIMITQSYATGQFVLQSAVMQQAYYDQLAQDKGGVDNAV